MIGKRLLAILFFLAAAVTNINCAPQADTPQPQSTRLDTVEEVALPQPPSIFRERIDAALEHVHRRDLLTTHGFWTIFHGILGQGLDTTLLDPVTNQRTNAIDYICRGGFVRGLVFEPMGPDGVDVQTQPGTGIGQGHQDQFVAEMVQWGLPLDRKFLVAGKEYTFEDFTRFSKLRAQVTGNQELTWAIIIIGQCYGTDITWKNRAAETVTFEDVVRYELNQPIESAACGGTHRLFGLTWAYHLHLQKGGKTTGVWKDVADKIELYKKKAHELQNRDGAFSTNYVSQPGNNKDMQVRISTTGHVLEWLSLALTKKELTEPWMQEAANALVMMILESRTDPIEGGALYHATHGLYMYRARVFGTKTPDVHMPLLPGE